MYCFNVIWLFLQCVIFRKNGFFFFVFLIFLQYFLQQYHDSVYLPIPPFFFFFFFFCFCIWFYIFLFIIIYSRVFFLYEKHLFLLLLNILIISHFFIWIIHNNELVLCSIQYYNVCMYIYFNFLIFRLSRQRRGFQTKSLFLI